jgi:hypothetical protein
MKLKTIVTIFIFIILFIDYGYCVHKTQTNPEEVRWGYFCGVLFATIFIWGIKLIIKKNK